MYNPFKEINDDSVKDVDLIDNALTGSREDLEKLILRHQGWIYNIAVRMTLDRVDAEDVTQEILVKMITNLLSYKSEMASFRTWLYRIVANHVLTMKKNHREITVGSIDQDQDFPEFFKELKDKRQEAYPENRVIANEAKTACLAGMLICLNRKQRLVFILSVIFNISDKEGSEILEITRSNFRKILSRGRDKIGKFLNESCSLLNESNPCKCSNLEKNLKNLGLMKQQSESEGALNYKSISDLVQDKLEDFKKYYFTDIVQLYRDQPFLEPPDQIPWIKNILDDHRFKNIFQLH